MALTDSWLRSVHSKKRDGILTKVDRDGLSVRVTSTGKIVYQYRYRWLGKGERIDIGTYPAISLKEARNITLEYAGDLQKNKNPRFVKELKKQTSADAMTVEDIIRKWWGTVMEGKLKSDELIIRGFELYIFPQIGKLLHDDVTLPIWLNAIEKTVKKAPSTAGRILTYSKSAHNWAYRRGIVNNCPLDKLATSDLGIKKNQRNRVLSNDELRLLFTVIQDGDLNYKTAYLVKLCLLFGCRVNELMQSTTADFDFNKMLWTIAADKHKTGSKTNQDLVRPIIEPAKKMILELIELNNNSKYLFPIGDGSKPVHFTGHLGLIERVITKMNNQISDFKPWSIHDLRKTMRTGISDLTSPHIAELMLGHKLPGVWQVYDKYTYLDEQREAYEKWWDKLNKIVAHSPSLESPRD